VNSERLFEEPFIGSSPSYRVIDSVIGSSQVFLIGSLLGVVSELLSCRFVGAAVWGVGESPAARERSD
jgi:hypothetical protein